MPIKLTNIRPLGRFTDTRTGKSYNVKKGYRAQRGTSLLFFLRRGTRNYIPDNEFYSDIWEEFVPKSAKPNAYIVNMNLPLVIEYRWPGCSWKRLYLHITTGEEGEERAKTFAIEYRELYSHNSEVRFEASTCEKASGYLYDAFKTHPHIYRLPKD